MNTRETSQTIEIKGRKFILNKFDPFYGSYLAFKVFSMQGKKDLNMSHILGCILGDNFEEFEKVTKQILKYCSEILPSGKVSLINSEGNIAVMDLTTDFTMELLSRELIFNLEGFFTEDQEAQNLMEHPKESI